MPHSVQTDAQSRGANIINSTKTTCAATIQSVDITRYLRLSWHFTHLTPQERLKAACKPSVHEMMFFMNAWALAILTVAAYVTGQGVDGFAFCAGNPAVMVRAFIFAGTFFFVFFSSVSES